MEYEPRSMVTAEESCLPGCCGVNVVHDAHFEDESSLKAAFQQLIDSNGAIDWHDNAGGGPPGLILYSVTHTEGKQATIKSVLEGMGFTALTTFKNPRTGNTITILGLAINQNARTPRRARAARGGTRRRQRGM
jgi:hypothetical protein